MKTKDPEQTIREVLSSLIERRDDGSIQVTLEARLFEDLDMDSLEVAELSAALEDDLGSDPFSQGIIPATVAELVEFYRA